MKLVSIKVNNEVKLGAIQGDRIVDLNYNGSMIDLLKSGEFGLEAARNAAEKATITYAKSEVTFVPPVVRPGKVIALGRNYAAHAAEGGAVPPDYPMLFHKTHTSLIGHHQSIVIPPVTKKVDYEAELAVIIGKTCYQVSEEDALDYVAGYTCANDVSARDLQRLTTQFTTGKMLDTFGPLGPALVTADEIDDVQNLNISLELNGETLQSSNTSYMIFNVAFTIHFISQICTLEPGDVILTGTPEGVGYPRNPPIFLKPGDSVTVHVENVGSLTNPVE
ncbi:MAG: acylpyruvate hydrolase [Cellvibrionaceae bacterium]|jgi:acylpyruvate hydrolase